MCHSDFTARVLALKSTDIPHNFHLLEPSNELKSKNRRLGSQTDRSQPKQISCMLGQVQILIQETRSKIKNQGHAENNDDFWCKNWC